MTVNCTLVRLTSSSASSLMLVSFSSLPFTASSVISVSLIAPKVPSNAQRISSVPAADNVRCCRHTTVVVVRPAYSFRSSGAISEILKSF